MRGIVMRGRRDGVQKMQLIFRTTIPFLPSPVPSKPTERATDTATTLFTNPQLPHESSDNLPHQFRYPNLLRPSNLARFKETDMRHDIVSQ